MNDDNNLGFQSENEMLKKELREQQERQIIAQKMSGNNEASSFNVDEHKESLGKISISNEKPKLIPKWAIVLFTLIIAGMVALAGFMVYRNITGPDTSKIDKVKAAAYNEKYLAYEGKDKNASEVRALLNHVKIQNGDEAKVAVYGEIEVRGIASLEEIRDGRTYVITDFTKDVLTGYVNGFTIKEQANF